MIKITILISMLVTSVFSVDYINYGKFKNNDSLFLEKDIKKLSSKFLGVKYVSHALSNNNINSQRENLIIDFDALDCFTYIDTIEALKGSHDKISFVNSLIDTRYKSGKITYENRNHFFSDWIESNRMIDITCTLGNCQEKIKYLNQNEKYLKEIKTVKRKISYINTKDIDSSLLLDGDYVGIYTDKEALDVTHTGIIIKNDNKIFLRHASSLKKEIIDSDLFEYTKNKLGIVVYRSTN